MPRPREHDATTRQALLDHAGAILAGEGIAGVSVRRVAEAAGTSTRAVYSLFGAKEGLLRALYFDGFDALRVRVEAVPVTDDPLADITALARAYRDSAVENRHLYGLMFHRTPGWDPPPEDRRTASQTLHPLGAAVGRAVAAGRYSGEVRATTLQLWALVHGLASLELTGDLGNAERATAHWDAAVAAGVLGHRA